MKLLFVSTLYPMESIDQLRGLASGCIQNAPNVFQWAVVDGLLKNDADFEVVSLPALPAFPMKYKKLYTLSGNVTANGKSIGVMLTYCDFVVYKTFSMRWQLQKYIKDWIKRNKKTGEQLVILTYTPYPPFIQAVKNIKKDYPNLIISSILTDLVDDMMNFKSNRSFLKRIQCYIEKKQTKRLYRYINKFILLTQAMEEKIPEAVEKSIIVEGIAIEVNYKKKEVFNDLKTLLYTGTLEEFSGIKDLVLAFRTIPNLNYRLIICGGGILSSFVREQLIYDDRIIYQGNIPREEALRLQHEATALINPRKPDNEITRFSFPSKTMEYLSSGTPMIGYKLEGIPSEYYDYYFTVSDSSLETLKNVIEMVLSLSQDELDAKASAAHQFVEKNKTSQIQVKKILDFILQ